MKTAFLRSIPFLLIFVFLTANFSLQAVEPVHNSIKANALVVSEDLHFTPDKDFEKRLNWREKLALKILKKRLKKQLNKGPGNLAFPISQTDGCVTIILKNGQRVKVEIVRMSKTEVTYKKCEEEKGEITMSWDMVAEVRGSKKLKKLVDEANNYLSPVLDHIPDYSAYDQCVTINFEYGVSQKVKILRTTDTTIIYHLCGEDASRELIAKRYEVRFIKAKKLTFTYRNPIYFPDAVNYKTTAGPKVVDKVSVASFVVGLFGVIFVVSGAPLIGVFLSLVGFITGIVSIVRIRKSRGRKSGVLFAVLGIIFGSLFGVLLGLLALIFVGF